MALIFFVLIGLVLFLIWCRLDYVFGKKNHNRRQHAVFYPVRQSDICFYDNGASFFDDYFEDIRNAEDHIHILFYIFRNDSIGSRLIALLCRKASEGVSVRVMLDRISGGMNKEGQRQLKQAGVSFIYSRPVSFPYLFYSLQRRNHRKITVIDGTTGYTGGFNVGDEYLGRDPQLDFWRDFHLRFTGGGVQDLQTQFIKDWKKEKPADDFSSKRYFPSVPVGRARSRFFATDGGGIKESFLHAIQKAEEHIYIASPYFIPGADVLQALLHAAERKVEITILLPGKRDHPLVKEASFSYLEKLTAAGAAVHHYQPGFFHVKAVIVDDQFCDVGSANFDKRSFHLNNEINTLLLDETLRNTVKQTLRQDISHSTRLQSSDFVHRSLFIRIKEKAAHLLESLL